MTNELGERSLPWVAGEASARTAGVDEVIDHLSGLECGPASVRQVEGAYVALMVAGGIAVASVAIYAYLASLASGDSLVKSEERTCDFELIIRNSPHDFTTKHLLIIMTTNRNSFLNQITVVECNPGI